MSPEKIHDFLTKKSTFRYNSNKNTHHMVEYEKISYSLPKDNIYGEDENVIFNNLIKKNLHYQDK
jgi:hypothetical protein